MYLRLDKKVTKMMTIIFFLAQCTVKRRMQLPGKHPSRHVVPVSLSGWKQVRQS